MTKFIKYFGIALLLVSSYAFASTFIYIKAPEIFSNSTYRQFEKIDNILETTNANQVIFDWQGVGGSVYTGVNFMNAVVDAENRHIQVVFHVIGFAASMHAYAVCSGTSVIFEPNAILMFHLRTTMGKVDHSVDSQNQAQELTQGCVDKGILTPYDVGQLRSGKEVYVNAFGHKAYEPDRREAK